LLSGFLIGIACLPALAQKPQNNSASACVRCHAAQATTQPQTPMGRAIELPEDDPTLKEHPKLTFRKAQYSYAVETVGGKTTYTVSDGANAISRPIRWAFGTGGQTWVWERDGQFYESLVSYYPALSGLDITMGDETIAPQSLDEAMGRKFTSSETKACFGCHGTHAVSGRNLTLESMELGVTCERCHAGSGAHLIDAVQGVLDSAPPKLGKLSSEQISNFCGRCHRTWETVVRGHFVGEVNVRFQPYRLANSKCFDGADPRISCLACHDPHQDLVRQDSFYDAKCLACHGHTNQAASVQPASTQSTSAPAPAGAKTCPVANADCVRCHMPKVNLPGGHQPFTDHQIRIVKTGEPYPN
jgi:cytochrome c7-like protein